MVGEHSGGNLFMIANVVLPSRRIEVEILFSLNAPSLPTVGLILKSPETSAYDALNSLNRSKDISIVY